jgi:hypothetical protein
MSTSFITNNTIGGTLQNISTAFTATTGSIVAVVATSGALQRTYIYSVFLGSNNVPNSTDCAIQMDLSLQTATGTATTVTPNPSHVLETGTEAGCRATSYANYTAAPTVTSNSSRLARAFNQRGFKEWVAIDDSDVIVGAAVAASGWVLRALSPDYASTVVGEIRFRE